VLGSFDYGKSKPWLIASRAVDLSEFRGRVFDVLLRVNEACENDPSVREQHMPQDLRGILSIAQDVASELILCDSVDEAINLLKRDQLKLGVVDYVANHALGTQEIESAILLAHAKTTEEPSALPCYPFGSFLSELCSGLEPGKRPDALL
jgi:hypothetical protein